MFEETEQPKRKKGRSFCLPTKRPAARPNLSHEVRLLTNLALYHRAIVARVWVGIVLGNLGKLADMFLQVQQKRPH